MTGSVAKKADSLLTLSWVCILEVP